MNLSLLFVGFGRALLISSLNLGGWLLLDFAFDKFEPFRAYELAFIAGTCCAWVAINYSQKEPDAA